VNFADAGFSTRPRSPRQRFSWSASGSSVRCARPGPAEQCKAARSIVRVSQSNCSQSDGPLAAVAATCESKPIIRIEKHRNILQRSPHQRQAHQAWFPRARTCYCIRWLLRKTSLRLLWRLAAALASIGPWPGCRLRSSSAVLVVLVVLWLLLRKLPSCSTREPGKLAKCIASCYFVSLPRSSGSWVPARTWSSSWSDSAGFLSARSHEAQQEGIRAGPGVFSGGRYAYANVLVRRRQPASSSCPSHRNSTVSESLCRAYVYGGCFGLHQDFGVFAVLGAVQGPGTAACCHLFTSPPSPISLLTGFHHRSYIPAASPSAESASTTLWLPLVALAGPRSVPAAADRARLDSSMARSCWLRWWNSKVRPLCVICFELCFFWLDRARLFFSGLVCFQGIF
jgi:hypothetical protein